ncbi:MAG: DUF6090 family protein [Saprospiraceae bacterium]
MRTRGRKHYFLELITIVIGILMSFFITEWRENQKHEKAELNYISNLKEEILSDTTQIHEEIKVLDFIARGADSILNIQSDERRYPDSIRMYFLSQPQYSTLPLRQTTYRELQQTGESKLISNRELLREVIEYYENTVWQIKEYNDIDKNMVLNELIPYYSANFDLKKVVAEFSTDLQAIQFVNLLTYNKNFKKVQIFLYREQLKKIKELGQKLQEEYKRLGGE